MHHRQLNFFILWSFFFLLPSIARAQYGKEWIEPNQKYYKISIGESHIYTLDFAALSEAGLPLESINPKNFQLYKNGKEQHIYVAGENDNSFDSGDFLEFYGEKNDGELDKPLYLNPADQPHKYMSLYEDTTNYYLTWSATTPGKRLADFQNSNYAGKVNDPWIMYESLLFFTDAFHDGSPYDNPGYFSEYTEGEGWFSVDISSTRNTTFQVNTEEYNSNGPAAQLSFGAYGKANPENNIDGKNMRLEVTIGSTFIFGLTHKGYTRIETGINVPNLSIPSNLIGVTTPIRFASTYLSRARHGLSFVKISYPRNLSLKNKDYFEFNYTATNDYFEFSDFIGSHATIYDLENKKRILGDISSSFLRFITPTTGAKKIVIVNDASKKQVQPSTIEEVVFNTTDYSNTSYDFIIVTHPKLAESAKEYKDYRESAEGGNYNVLIAYMPEIYEKYYYGLKHPLALRNFCKDIYTSQSKKPEYVLLLGKGQSYFRTRFNYSRRELENLVPTWGEPASDYPFVTDYTTNDLTPVMAIGRIPARNNNDVRKYLYKLKKHEEFLNKSKKVLFVTGGYGLSEQARLQAHQLSYYNTMKGEKFGAQGVMVEKKDNESIAKSYAEEIQKNINDGIQTLSYFGHGASQILEIDIGKPNQLNNEGKYPLFVFNGCLLGNTFADISLPEEFLFEEKTGGIAWIAGSAYNFISPLATWTRIFYQNLYNEYYGESIGKVMAATMEKYQQPTNDYNRSQCRQTLYHGDPAIRLYAPEKPDFQIDESGLKIYPENANAEMDSFALDMRLFNVGSAQKKEPLVHVSLKYSNDSIRNFKPKTFGPIHNSQPCLFWLPVTPFGAGFQTATITIDYGDSIKELEPLGELNNTVIFDFNLPSNSLSVLYPKKDDIQPENKVTLKVQNNNLLRKGNVVVFQIDTTPLFNSPIMQLSQEIVADNIIEHSFLLPPFDSTDFFWKAAFVSDQEKPEKWVSSTFSLVLASENGWSQGYKGKLAESKGDGIYFDADRNKLAFQRTLSWRYDMYSGGINTTWFKINLMEDNRKSHGNYARNAVEVMVVNPDNLDRYNEEDNVYNRTNRDRDAIPGYKYYIAGEKSAVYYFYPKTDVGYDSMYNFLNRVPHGWHIFLLINGDVGLDNWNDSMFTALEQFGAAKIRPLKHGEPYGLMGYKGDEIGKATELVANPESNVDPSYQEIPGSKQFTPLLTSGSITSQKIGPSQKWKQFYRIFGDEKDSEADSFNYSIIGITHTNRDTVLVHRTLAKTVDLSFIDATEYPYLKIRAFFKDEEMRTPAPQKRWTVLYDGVPEGSLMPDLVFEQTHDTIQEGDSIGFKIAYKNISTFGMDSLLVMAVNLASSNSRDTIELKRYQPLAPGDSVVLSYKLHTLGKIANNSFIIAVNPNFDQPEERLENNIINLHYVVEKDVKNPILDVVFDGLHILDYDIVSPSPVITMSVLDDNDFLFINDPTAIKAAITPVDELGNPIGTVDSLLHTLSNATFYPATAPGDKAVLEYLPDDLESGKYRLDVAVTDASGNASSDLNYRIHFEVIKESQITNIYPYPNPFSTSMKFVYTLTGEQIPDYMKIQILTITGKVVREITQNELGLIRIGNNISEFTWNGTDEFGDQLANGVYLYKVTARINGEEIQQRETAGDKFFHKGYGKIYLMR